MAKRKLDLMERKLLLCITCGIKRKDLKEHVYLSRRKTKKMLEAMYLKLHANNKDTALSNAFIIGEITRTELRFAKATMGIYFNK